MLLLRGENMGRPKTQQKSSTIKSPSVVEMPFGATSRKQQMILDSEAEILVIGGGVQRHNT